MLYFALNTRTQFSQVLCHFITRVKFSPVSKSILLIPVWGLRPHQNCFNVHTSTSSLLMMMIYICIYMYMCAQSFQSCPTLCDPVDHGPPGSSVHEILQARILKWVAISFSRGSSWPRIEPGSPALQADQLSYKGSFVFVVFPILYNITVLYSVANIICGT